jgi:hypothetical protein
MQSVEAGRWQKNGSRDFLSMETAPRAKCKQNML